MFCTNCGYELKALDKFCGGCGQRRLHRDIRQAPQDKPSTERDTERTVSPSETPDWSWENSYDYSSIIRESIVQDLFETAQRRGKQGLGLNDYFDILTPILPSSGKAVFTFSSKLGVAIVERTNLAYNHVISQQFSESPGLLIAALACTFAGKKYDVSDIRQGEDELTTLSLVPATLTRGQYVLESRVSPSYDQTLISLTFKALLGGLAKNRSQKIASEIFEYINNYLQELHALRKARR